MNIIIYKKDNCKWCDKVMNLLDELGHTFVVKNIDENLADLLEFMELENIARTMPQVQIDGVVIGGYEETLKYFKTINKVNNND